MSAAQDARAPDSAATGWRAMVTGERLPRFALICVGMWLTAADTLMTATIMPSVAADIGGYAWFGWAVAIFMLGSILAGATSGQLSKRIGLRTAMAVAGLVYAIGCALSAAAPNIAAFLVGRFAQGIGGGWVVGLCYVAVSSLFPQPLWPRVFSAISGVWGVATLLSPLIGGLFAQAGHWRAAFWLFAAQGLAFIAAAAVLVTRNAAPAEDSIEHAPLAQLAPLSLGVVAIAAAGLVASPILAAGLGAAGLALVALFLRMDLRASASLLPRTSADPRGGVGAGLAMIFLLSVGTASFTAYGPAIMQTLFGLSPIQAGYTLGAEAAAWTIVALVFASVWTPAAKIRVGAMAVGLGIAALAYVMPRGPIAAIVACAVLLGGGFGLNWAMLAERIVANAAPDEQSLAASSVPTTQMIGTAVGAAAAGAIANLFGFAGGIDRPKALAGGFWLFAAFIPVAALGIAAAWRLAAAQFDPKPASD